MGLTIRFCLVFPSQTLFEPDLTRDCLLGAHSLSNFPPTDSRDCNVG